MKQPLQLDLKVSLMPMDRIGHFWNCISLLMELYVPVYLEITSIAYRYPQ